MRVLVPGAATAAPAAATDQQQRGRKSPWGGLSDPSCPMGNRLGSLNPTYLQRSGIIQPEGKQDLPSFAGGVTVCPASLVPPPASPGEVQGSGSHPATAGPHCPSHRSQAAQCGTPDLQPNSLQYAGEQSGCTSQASGDFSLLCSHRLRYLLCPPEHPSPASPTACSHRPLVPAALHCCTQQRVHCVLAARSDIV